MAAPSAQEPSGPDETSARRPDGPDGDPWQDEAAGWRSDPMTAAEREAWLDHLAEEDLEDFAPLTAEELAEIREFAGPWAGCRAGGGPGQPGSARVFPGESGSRAAFGS